MKTSKKLNITSNFSSYIYLLRQKIKILNFSKIIKKNQYIMKIIAPIPPMVASFNVEKNRYSNRLLIDL